MTTSTMPHTAEPMAQAPKGDVSPADLSRIAQDLQVRKVQVEAVMHLLDEGNTIPFITRYRKERTGGLDEEVLRIIQERIHHARQLNERKAFILRTIESQHSDKLTDELRAAILAADNPKRLEDLYHPFKRKRNTLAEKARERGLENLATAIWTADPIVANLEEVLPTLINPEQELTSTDVILEGAGHIIAEWINDAAEVRGAIRYVLWESGKLVTAKSEKLAEGQGQEYREYFNFSEPVRVIPPHRVLAINRGEKDNALTVKMEWDAPGGRAFAIERVPLPRKEAPPAEAPPADAPSADSPPPEQHHHGRGHRGQRPESRLADLEKHPHRAFIEHCFDDALNRLLVPSLEREIRRELTQRAENHAVVVFARNLRSKLLAAPLRDRRILAVDPAFRTGCKLAVLDEVGNLLTEGVIYPHQPQNRKDEARAKLEELICRHQVQVIAIGNGTACRETEELVSEVIAGLEHKRNNPTPPAEPVPHPPEATEPPPLPQEPLPDAVPDLAYVIVNEAGASVYSASSVGREEFPHLDATLRGTISIGRRLQDPLSELVKIDPQHVGVGLYQHDVSPKHLRESLEAVIESCVNTVGVDLNTASAPLLRHVSGLGPRLAEELINYRKANGPFRSRQQLLQVPGIGEGRFVQMAGFLKVHGDDPLDRTWIHPESYEAAREVLTELGFTPASLDDSQQLEGLREKLKTINAEEITQRLQEKGARVAGEPIGLPTVKDILEALAKPGRDPREDLPPPVFKKGIQKLEDLQAGMELKGTVLNVVDFGAFIDVGLKDSGLVHISQMANRYVKTPHDVVSVGDVVSVWVLSVDGQRHRVSLTMIPPGTERRPPERRERPARGERPPREGGEPPREPRGDRPRPQPQGQGDRPRPQPQGDRPPRGDRGDRSRPPMGGKPRSTLPPRGVSRIGTAAQQRGQRKPGEQPGEGAAEGQEQAGSAKKQQRRQATPKVSAEALSGKAPLRGFGELAALLAAREEQPTAATPPPEVPPPEEAPPPPAANEETPPPPPA